jgi:starch synthase (maltosyl-transferring)
VRRGERLDIGREDDGRKRVAIAGVKPQVDGGRFPVKRTVGERVVVEADVFGDGHDLLFCLLLYRREGESEWREAPLRSLGNDRWRGEFTVTEVGFYRYTILALVDHFQSWHQHLLKKIRAGQDVSVDLVVGAELLEAASTRASGADGAFLASRAAALRSSHGATERALPLLDQGLLGVAGRYPDRRFAATYERELRVRVDRERARFSAWYEMFPRSSSPEPGKYGTFKDCEARLPYVSAMGFDVLYLSPIHPIGTTNRKGRNNDPASSRDDPGSPWAIGSAEGGHTAIDPRLGTVKGFQSLLAKAREQRLELALDIAFQCSPDHPYVGEHPEWFRWRPDGTLQYAENPPKKYEDIYPFNFETDNWRELWIELKGVFLFWIKQGVRIFRVDNPHTKPFAFWEWVIGEIQRDYPEAIFLAEAFTRPTVMYHLAKVGFTQSYTYFAWRNTKREITEYFTELSKSDGREYFRPNLWPNTPDILTEYLQMGGRPAFMIRLVLAATLAASYGIYGPSFELGDNRSREPGSEEYLDSEKYQVRHWEISDPNSLKDFIARVNRIRRDNPALHHDWNLRFHEVDNDQLICFSKCTDDAANAILVVVNLDPHHAHAGWLDLDLEALGIQTDRPYQVHDLLSDARFLWSGSRNYVELDPRIVPAHIFRVRHYVRTERDFDYFM